MNFNQKFSHHHWRKILGLQAVQRLVMSCPLLSLLFTEMPPTGLTSEQIRVFRCSTQKAAVSDDI